MTRLPHSTAEIDGWVDQFLPLVEKIIRARIRTLPASIELEDLRQVGRLGLVIAARHPKRPKDAGEAWAAIWIRRQLGDWIAGPGRRYANGEAAYAFNRIDLTERTDHQQALEAYQRTTATMDERAGLTEAMDRAKDGLTDRQRRLIDLVYEHGQSLAQVGRSRSVGIGVRRVVDEHGAALKRLKDELEEAGFQAA